MKQVSECVAIYIHGGDDHLVLYWLKQFDIPKIWDGKTVATNSASSNALVKYFWTCDWRTLMDGLGILPIKFLAHFESDYGINDPRGPVDWAAGYKELESDHSTLVTHAIKEGKYIVFEQ